MKKTWQALIGAGLGVLLCTTVVLAAEQAIKVTINGQPLEAHPAPQLVDGKVVVPLRETAEALGAEVIWKEETKEAEVRLPSYTSLEKQISLLHQAVAAETPLEAVETWVKGIQMRNGALQYALLSPELKESKLASFEALGWVTGTSSPWLEQYRIDSGRENEDGTWTFQVQLDFRTSEDVNEPERWEEIPALPVTVKEYAGYWYIADYPEGEGLD